MTKITIIGQPASGKSTFSELLGEKTGVPVFHTDKFLKKYGRSNKNKIQKEIEKICKEKDWIIEGNAFTKDTKNIRILNSDIIFIFDFNIFYSLFNFLKRHIKYLFLKEEKKYWTHQNKLELSYFIPYIFYKFPKRKKEFIKEAEKYNKKIIYFHNYSDIDNFLKK